MLKISNCKAHSVGLATPPVVTAQAEAAIKEVDMAAAEAATMATEGAPQPVASREADTVVEAREVIANSVPPIVPQLAAVAPTSRL